MDIFVLLATMFTCFLIGVPIAYALVIQFADQFLAIRGLAALFVVLNHIFERGWPGYPANPAPFWAAG